MLIKTLKWRRKNDFIKDLGLFSMPDVLCFCDDTIYNSVTFHMVF